jgi:SAM-dependent methyltransferase
MATDPSDKGCRKGLDKGLDKGPDPSHLQDTLRYESENLSKSWVQYDAQMLQRYLVAGVEDPRINVQSILTRHFLVVALSGKRFEHLVEQELRFAVVLNWAREAWKGIASTEDIEALRHALQTGADNAEGLAIPTFVRATFAALPVVSDGVPVPNYVIQLLDDGQRDPASPELSPEALATFQVAWSKALQDAVPSTLTVLEPACGSANDYRFLDGFGLARLTDYSGFDLCETNIANARAMFPQARFTVGNAFAIPSGDRTFDFCLVHDLFEHLSLEGMERALGEVCRVTRQGLCLGSFNAYEGDEHIVRPVDDYYWNTLSVPRLRKLLEGRGFSVQIVHIDTFLKWRFGFDRTHNQNAYTLFAARVV